MRILPLQEQVEDVKADIERIEDSPIEIPSFLSTDDIDKTVGMMFYTTDDGLFHLVIDSEGNTKEFIDTTKFQYHTDTDLKRWQEFADLKTMVYDIKASLVDQVLDKANEINIESESQGDGYVVSNTLGGVVTFTAVNILLSFGTLNINGKEEWSSAGLTLGLGGITDSRVVDHGDIITCSGMSSITFTPYIPG